MCAGEKPYVSSGWRDPQAKFDPERTEDAAEAGVCAQHLGEAAQTGAQPAAGHEAEPGEIQPGAAQVRLANI